VYWGTCSEEQGRLDQELEFLPGGAMKLRVLGQEVEGTYNIDVRDPLLAMDINMPEQGRVPHIFRFTERGLDLCGPTEGSQNRPTEFAGPSLLSLVRGPQPRREPDPEIMALSLHDKLVLYAIKHAAVIPPNVRPPAYDATHQEHKDAYMTSLRYQRDVYSLQQDFGQEVTELVMDLALDVRPQNTGDSFERSPQLLDATQALRAKLLEAGVIDPEILKRLQAEARAQQEEQEKRKEQQQKQQRQAAAMPRAAENADDEEEIVVESAAKRERPRAQAAKPAAPKKSKLVIVATAFGAAFVAAHKFWQ
jgi:hypothetical protein